MPARGRRWKTFVSRYGKPSSTSSFPPSPTALGNRQRRDFHIPTAPTVCRDDKTKTTRLSPFGRLPNQIQSREKLPIAAQPGVRDFRLISHWNRRSVSGSLRVGIKSRFQAHFWIGKCWGGVVSRDDFLPIGQSVLADRLADQRLQDCWACRRPTPSATSRAARSTQGEGSRSSCLMATSSRVYQIRLSDLRGRRASLLKDRSYSI